MASSGKCAGQRAKMIHDAPLPVEILNFKPNLILFKDRPVIAFALDGHHNAKRI
jgi:hypothetical protein